MTAKELIEHLQQLPKDTEVYVCTNFINGNLDSIIEVVYDDACIDIPGSEGHPYPAIILIQLNS